MLDIVRVQVTVNGALFDREVEARTTLADFLRNDLGLTGTHIGCEHGACGACTVLMNGETVRSCIIYAPQIAGADILTIEGVSDPEDGERMHPIQEAMMECHGLQCGFCTPGMILTILEMLNGSRGWNDVEIRGALSGNLCRCTGYESIVSAVREVDAKWVRTVVEDSGG